MGIPSKISKKFPEFHSLISTSIGFLSSLSRKSVPLKKIRYVLKKNNKLKDKFVIFGSGQSINNISESEWEFFRRETTTLGINEWFRNDFIPDLYTTEAEFNKKKYIESHKLHCQGIQERVNDYKNTIFATKTKDFNSARNIESNIFKDQIKYRFYPNSFSAPHGSNETFKYFCKKLYPLVTKLNPNLIPSTRSNIIFATFLSKQLGAKEVIYVGVDGYGGYFFKNQLTDYEKSLRHTNENSVAIQRGWNENNAMPNIPQILQANLMDIY